MVGWPTRWESRVESDQHHHLHQHPHLRHPGLSTTEQVAAVGLDLPTASTSTSTSTPSSAHNNHSHALNPSDFPPQTHIPFASLCPTDSKGCSSSSSPSSSSTSSLDRGPSLDGGGRQDPPFQNNKSPSSPLLHSHNKNYLPTLGSSSGPPCSSALTEEGHSTSSKPPAVSCGGSVADLPHPPSSSRGGPNNNHSFLCHNSSSTPVVQPPTSLNGTSRSTGTPLSAHQLDELYPWTDLAETAPLTTANNNGGEVGRFRVNGVATTMAVKEEALGEGEEEEEEEARQEDVICGLGKWCSPPWAQRLANKQMFLLTFCLTSVLQGMFYTYFVSVITTIEKLFQLKSKTTGIIMSATEMGQIGGALLLTYYGGHGHRPKWIGWGMMLFAFCALLCSLPHFLFGPHLLEKHLEMTPSRHNPLETANTCKLPGPRSSTVMPSLAGTVVPLEGDNETLPGLLEDEESPCETEDSYGVLAIFFISLLGVGIRQTAAYHLGIPYIDDNVASQDTPLYFAGTSGVRILGPTLVFVLGSFCTRLYVNPLDDPGIDTSDPRFIGAWWLGLVVVSVALFLTSAAMFAFPRQLPSSPKGIHASFSSPTLNPSLKDFPKAVRRLLGNKILMLRTASSVLHILPIAGLYTFLPKYLESQFRLSVHNAALVSGIGGILVMGIGIFASGIFIRKAKPTARAVAGWIALTALVYSIGMIILMFVGCTHDDLVGLIENESTGKHFTPQCERTCGRCDDSMYAPVCDSNEKTHFSACHLGCTNATHVVDSNKIMFSNCECLEEGATAELRICELQCDNFVWYVIIFSIFVLVHSTSEVGGMLVTLRCVEPKDKAMALGLISVAIGLFGNVPCPIIYGAVVDSACIQWKERCGAPLGACQLYDSSVFRMFFHGITGTVMLMAFLVDLVVWHKAKDVSFTEDEDVMPEEITHMNPNSLSQSPSTVVVTEQTPTTSTAQEISPVSSPSEGVASVSHEEKQSESGV